MVYCDTVILVGGFQNQEKLSNLAIDSVCDHNSLSVHDGLPTNVLVNH